MISSDGSDSKTDFDDLEQTDSALCQLVISSSGNDTSIAAEAQGDGLTPNNSKIGWVSKDGTKWECIEFFSKLKGRLQAQNVITESKGLTRHSNCMLKGLLSAFELLVDNSMLTNVQQCTKLKSTK